MISNQLKKNLWEKSTTESVGTPKSFNAFSTTRDRNCVLLTTSGSEKMSSTI